MAITVSGTTITFNDATTQTTAAVAGVTSAVAGNGVAVSGATGAVTFSLGVPTSSSVGTYTIAYPSQTNNTTVDYTIGTTIAGSNLLLNTDFLSTVNVIFKNENFAALVTASLSGTWRACARVKNIRGVCGNDLFSSTLWIRTA
jgi:hypothetical protein